MTAQKRFTPKEESLGINLNTISMNYMLTPINTIISNASAKKCTNYLADSLWENQKLLKWFPKSAKNCPSAKMKLLQTFFWVRKTQICWLFQIMTKLWRRVPLPCQPTVNNFPKCVSAFSLEKSYSLEKMALTVHKQAYYNKKIKVCLFPKKRKNQNFSSTIYHSWWLNFLVFFC